MEEEEEEEEEGICAQKVGVSITIPIFQRSVNSQVRRSCTSMITCFSDDAKKNIPTVFTIMDKLQQFYHLKVLKIQIFLKRR